MTQSARLAGLMRGDPQITEAATTTTHRGTVLDDAAQDAAEAAFNRERDGETFSRLECYPDGSDVICKMTTRQTVKVTPA